MINALYLLPLAVKQAAQLYNSQRAGDNNPEPNHWDMVDRFGLIHGYFNAGDFHKGQKEAIEFCDVYDCELPAVLVQFKEKCKELDSWTAPKATVYPFKY